MTTVNKLPSDSNELQALIAANMAQFKFDEKHAGSKAALLQLSQTLLEVMDELSASPGKSSGSKVVRPDFKAGSASNSGTNGAPSNAQMQKELGELMLVL